MDENSPDITLPQAKKGAVFLYTRADHYKYLICGLPNHCFLVKHTLLRIHCKRSDF